MAEHTPTPWELFDDSGVTAIINPRACSSKREIVFWTGFDASHYPKQAKANAAFIVKAVNNHDQMVKALEEIEALGEKADLKNEIGIRAGNIAHAALIAVRSRVGLPGGRP